MINIKIVILETNLVKNQERVQEKTNVIYTSNPNNKTITKLLNFDQLSIKNTKILKTRRKNSYPEKQRIESKSEKRPIAIATSCERLGLCAAELSLMLFDRERERDREEERERGGRLRG